MNFESISTDTKHADINLEHVDFLNVKDTSTSILNKADSDSTVVLSNVTISGDTSVGVRHDK